MPFPKASSSLWERRWTGLSTHRSNCREVSGFGSEVNREGTSASQHGVPLDPLCTQWGGV